MSRSIRAPRAGKAETVQRLLDATASILSADGAAGVSIQRVADVAATSKGLVHYHFRGKGALLAACTEYLTLQVIAAEEGALANSTGATALNDLWAVFTATVGSGARRALAALGTDATPDTRPALAESGARRRQAAEATIADLETLVGFKTVVPRSALAAAYVALTDGLALDLSVRPQVDARPAFDAFWLAVLTLGAE